MAFKTLQDKPVLIGTGSAFVCCERPVISCRVWYLVLLRKKGAFETLPKQPKTIQNPRKFHLDPPKIDPKTSQNRAQDAPKSRSGGDSAGNRVSIPNRSPNYSLLEVSWAVLGASWARLGAVLELSWSVFGRLGRILGASGDVLGASCVYSMKTDPKNHRF